MIKKENKLIQITLDPENLQLLNSLVIRTHNSKTDIIKQAIKLYAANNNHVYTVILHEKTSENNVKNEEDVEWSDIEKKLNKLRKKNS